MAKTVMAKPTGHVSLVAIGPGAPQPSARRWPLAVALVLSLFLGDRLFRAGGADLVGVSRGLSLLLVGLTAAWVALTLRGLDD